jgi:hypothetical protein
MEHRSPRIEPAKLEPSYASDLLQRQEALQAEAHTVLADLDLMALLARAGQPVLVGSAALGLMTWRDIDVEVYCNPWSADHAFETMRPLASYARVKKLRYSNESGPLRSAGLPDGYYWGVRCYTEAGEEWKIDVWFLPDGAPRPGMAPTHAIPERLTPERRLAILWIKDVWHRLPAYRHRVLSVDIYDAVLEHGVRTPAEFDAYLAARGKPARELQ